MAIIPERDDDGNIIQPKDQFNKPGWSYQSHGIEFETSVLNSIYEKDDKDNAMGFATLKTYNDLAMTQESTDQADADLNAVKTVINWEPTFDYELLKGEMFTDLMPVADLRVFTIGVPDIPPPLGSKYFICGMNLKYIKSQHILIDGERTKLLEYNAIYHTNKLRIVLNHNAGFKHKLHVLFSIFRA